MKHFFKGQAYPSHEFILSLGFSRKKGQKCSLLLFSLVNFCRQGQFLFFGAGCHILSQLNGLQNIKTVTQHNRNIVFPVNRIKILNIVGLLVKTDNQ